MRQALHRTFIAHPQSVEESYVEHAGVALSFAGRLLAAGCAALVHAVVPSLFEKTASNMIRSLHAEIANRGHRDHG